MNHESWIIRVKSRRAASEEAAYVNSREVRSVSAIFELNVTHPGSSTCSTSGVAQSGRIGAAALGKCLLLGARTHQHRRHAVVPLVTSRLPVDPICLVVLFRQFLLDSPRSRPRCR